MRGKMRLPSKEKLDETRAWLKGCRHPKALYTPPKSGRFLWVGLTETEKTECKDNKGKLPWVIWNSAWKSVLVNYEYTVSVLKADGKSIETLDKGNKNE